MARMVSETVTILREQLTRLEEEARTVRAAIAALNSVGTTDTIRASMSTPPNSQAQFSESGRRKRVVHYKYEQVCTRCQKSYMAARQARQGTDQFCHNPCTSSLYRDEAIEKAREIQKAEKAEREQGKQKQVTTLLSGDALRSGRH